ncbi:mechanosensitive ion channel family protein [Helicobacter mustelae]|uniref:Putative integral membrane protein Mechanosensitive ion channel n=1 Tax=Helicobacter mustelae (strain ATCC 43772 / CCUG 25715 / CIP 103759 / LMG 18044 / NCTC 12198 / R85-136P) TaxID=679897 RepID=D3UG06_HELM1|nr:mechanosensitive ion channel family protein [Helicobacter mustelae]CBG39427.1 putative integral membrane protein; Mechanosensitive ion channel [Helicobacter mustelae 12198]SQH70939.1 potassium efflux system KefA protein / Small-conductance mechanosensitive channel [Helicobacter mustelae]
MKKFFGVLIFFGVFLSCLWGNEFEDTLEKLILLNHQIALLQANGNSDGIDALEEQKTYELKKMTLELIASKEDFSQNLQGIADEQADITEKIKQDIRHNDVQDMEFQRLTYATLNLQKIIQTFVLNLQKNIGLFSQESDVTKIIQSTKKELQKQPHFSNKALAKQSAEYEKMLTTYQEVMDYFAKHPRTLLPQNAFINIGVGWVLQKIATFVPIGGSDLLVAKALLSFVTLAFLLACRKFFAYLIFSCINFFAHFSNGNNSLGDKICRDITKPITYALLFISFDVAVGILYYPNVSPQKIQMWFGVSYIFVGVWFFITLLKSYGVGIMGSILQKKDGFRKEAINMILKVSYFFICVIGILITLKYMGFNISTIMASLGIGGLAVALALKDMLANFFASIMLLFENSFSQGDWVVCNGIEGMVVEMGLRRTTIRTFDNALVLVPNSTLANAAILNWNRRKVGRRIKLSVGVTYDSSMEKIQKTIKDIHQMLLDHPNIAKDNKEDLKIDHYELAFRQNIVSMQDLLGYKDDLFVVLDTFDDSSINILVYCFSKSVVWGEFLDIKQDVMFRIMKIVEENGLSFAFPSQSLYIETLPKNAAI